MKTNKLGIPIDTDSDKPHEIGHSINNVVLCKLHNKIITYYRMFRINKPYISYLYGISLIKKYKQCTKQIN